MDMNEVYPNPRNFAPTSPTLVGRSKSEIGPLDSGRECRIFSAKPKQIATLPHQSIQQEISSVLRRPSVALPIG